MAAAVFSSTAAALAAGVATSSDVRPRPGLVAAAAAAGGLSGYFLWSWVVADCSSAVDRALRQVEKVQKQKPRRPQDALDDSEYSREVERWVVRLRGGPNLVSPALRIAACSQRLQQKDDQQADLIKALLQRAGLEDNVSLRVCGLLAKEFPLGRDSEMQALEDAVALVFLEHELDIVQKGVDDATLTDIFQKTWRKMSCQAQAFALALDFQPRILGCLVEAIATVEGLSAVPSPMVAPRLPAQTVALLRESWATVPKDSFGKEFLERLLAEDDNLSSIFDTPILRPSNIPKVVQMLLDLLDLDSVPRLERITHAVASLSQRFGSFRMSHLAAVKRALVRCMTTHAPPREKKTVNRVWEAFFYALAAVAGPHLVMCDRLDEFAAATAATLPTPGSGPHAGALAAQGAALLEMSLGITALNPGNSAAYAEVLSKLREARGWMLDAVREDVNAYCGLLSSVYAKPLQEDARAPSASSPAGAFATGVSVAEAERHRWLRRAAEVPLRVAEVSMGVAIACLPWRKQIKRSLQADWIAGAKMLQAAAEISVRNATVNVRDMQRGAPEIEKRLAQLRDIEPPWEDLCDIMS